MSPDRAANRSFLIDPQGEIVARYDKIHMFDVDLAGGESYRESRSYRPGEQAAVADLPWGRLGLTICYDLRFPDAATARWPRPARPSSRCPSAFTRQTGEAHWHVLLRARAIENTAVRVRGRAGRAPRGRPRHLRPFAGRRPVGRDPRGGRHRAGRGDGRDRSGRGCDGARRGSPRSSTAGASRWSSRMRRDRASARGRRLLMIRYALACERPYLRELVPEFRGLRQAGEARPGRLPGLRQQQGREGADGADARGHQEARPSGAAGGDARAPLPRLP